MGEYELYLKKSLKRLKEVIVDMECRPILFIGSGLSKRYINSPSWSELLEKMIELNPKIEKPFGYYQQKAAGNLPKIATILEDEYHSYAWDFYKDKIFPEELYLGKYSKGIFLKYQIAKYFDALLSEYLQERESNSYKEEIKLLSETEPHAIITTNYDRFIETIFPEYNPIISQTIIRKPLYAEIGEILKIHGCTTDPNSIVISEYDYNEFLSKRKYLSAKLLTYFVEYPLIFIGYSVSDENIKSILTDISEMLPNDRDDVVENIWFVEWKETIRSDKKPPEEKVIDLGNGNTIRINYLQVTTFTELFEALSQPVAVKKANVKLLRTLMSNVYEIVKNKSSKSNLQVNIATLDQLSDEGNLLNVLGFGEIDPSNVISVVYPYSLTAVAQKLGYENWYYANNLIEKVYRETKFSIKKSNNIYHQDVGLNGQAIRRYSEDLVILLQKIKNKQPYYVITGEGEKVYANKK